MAQHDHKDHILPFSLYMKIGATLLVLTGVTVWVAQYHLGEFNLLVAMIIALLKGLLVALFFMHLKYTSKLFSVVFVGALLMLAVFITFTMFDTMSRDTLYEEVAQPIKSEATIYNRVDSAATATPSASPVEEQSAGH